MADERAQWGSRTGFILAAIGSAVGFGSLARFPMNAANFGGAAFVLLYTVLMVAVGIPMMVGEFSLGRAAESNTVGVFKKLTGRDNTRWKLAGIFLFCLAGFFLAWYAVTVGWVLRYLVASFTGAYFDDPGAYLFDTAEGPDALLWTIVALVLTVLVVVSDVSKGIEKLNKVLMPTLFVMVIGLAVYAATLDNVAAGYSFYLKPDFSKLTLPVFTAAVGQAFFSLSLGIGSMMVFASYLSRETSLTENAALISISTLVFALIAGFMVFPMLASFDLLDTGAAGLSLIFGPLPMAFAEMGTPVGQIVGSLFFLSVFFAAFSSSVALTEPAIAYVTEEHGVDRRRAAILVVSVIYAGGIAIAFSESLLDFAGGKLTDTGVIIGGLFIALYIGWFSDAAKARHRMDESDGGWRIGWYAYPLIKYVMPVILTVLLLFAVLGTPCLLSGDVADQGLIERIFGLSALGCNAA